jgi:dTDP-D-glucose 4,6-dehydratase
MNSKKILVTGGAGFIGTNRVLELQERGHDCLFEDTINVNNLRQFLPASGIKSLLHCYQSISTNFFNKKNVVLYPSPCQKLYFKLPNSDTINTTNPV